MDYPATYLFVCLLFGSVTPKKPDETPFSFTFPKRPQHFPVFDPISCCAHRLPELRQRIRTRERYDEHPVRLDLGRNGSVFFGSLSVVSSDDTLPSHPIFASFINISGLDAYWHYFMHSHTSLCEHASFLDIYFASEMNRFMLPSSISNTPLATLLLVP